MLYLELKIDWVNSEDVTGTTYTQYTFSIGDFSGFDKSIFIRSGILKIERQNFNGLFTVDEIFEKLLPELYAKAKANGYQTFQ